MRRLFDRLLVALIPYTGLLTVSTCGAPADCEEPGDRKTVNMTAKVSSDIDLQSAIDGAITDESWRCEGRVFARRDRATDDTSLAPLPATAQIFCSIEEESGLTKATWTFTVPLEDLRAPAFAPETTTAIEMNRQAHRQPAASCNAKVDVRVASVIASEAGASAAPPKWVSDDFARRITTTIVFDGGGCGAMTGKVSLDIALDASSFVEGDTPTCL